MFNKISVSVAICLVIAMCVSFTSFGQQYKTCSTDAHYQKILKEYPELTNYEAQFSQQIRQRIAEKIASSGASDTATYDIPLVVHVIHDYGVENIPDDVIYAAAAYWAVVYVEQNEDTADVITPFIPYIGNPKIRLHLATIDPNGKPTKGVVRFQSYLTKNAGDEAKYDQWPPNEYVNIWFINAFGSDDAGAAAYAYLPPTAVYLPFYDGVIALSSYVNTGKTIPHEIGHVLNLYHPWGATNQPGVACGDDSVDDTPPTMGHEPVGCVASALYDVTCAVGYSKTYESSDGTRDSIVHYPDTTNAQNIMDYTYCQKMFTKQQAFRMRAALTSNIAERNNLYTPANLAATGALAPMPDLLPVADYVVNGGIGGFAFTDKRAYFMSFNNAALFSFQNWSWNDTISNVSWQFSNGAATPSATSTTTIENQFSIPGWVTLTLVATSNAGSDTLVNTHAVYAADTTPAGGLGYLQIFSNAANISNWPMFNYYNNQFKWEFYNGASYGANDNGCIRYRSFDSSTRLIGDAYGDYDDIYTPAFDLSNAPADLYVNFYTAGASFPSSGIGYFGPGITDDTMEVDASLNGGRTWAKLQVLGEATLANNGSQSTEFVPSSASQWVAHAVAIPATYRTANTFFRFRYRPGTIGNDLYLDNFELGQFPAGVKEIVNTPNTFNIYPNPANNGCNVAFKTGNDGIVAFTIKDVTGKLVYEAQKTYAANSIQQETITRSITPNAGLYFVTITIDGVHMTQKLVVY